MRRNDWRRLVAPGAFLLAATLAVLLIRSGLHAGQSAKPTTTVIPTTPHKTVATATTKKKKPKKAPSGTERFWTVQAGDTFGTISAKTGVPVATIQQLNPNVQSTALFIGEKLRIR